MKSSILPLIIAFLIPTSFFFNSRIFNVAVSRVSKLLPDEEILHNKRPNWLKGLKLDIYIPNKKLAFEYHGIQHYEPVEFFGGNLALKNRQAKDSFKKGIM